MKESKYLSLLLRHKPEVGNLVLDKEGWVSVADVVRALRDKFDPSFSKRSLISIVEDNDKQRFVLSPDQQKIRANQGHSIAVDLALSPATPPEFLYHGTKVDFLKSILHNGLTPQKRIHVHLSATRDTAEIVAKRRSGPSVILKINTQACDNKFYLSENGVWLTNMVPPEAIEIEEYM
jgi:putative RNA 2'-phosphotransferase